MLAESVAERMKKKGYYANCVCLWIKDTELQSFERHLTLKSPTNVSEDIAKNCYDLFLKNYDTLVGLFKVKCLSNDCSSVSFIHRHTQLA